MLSCVGTAGKNYQKTPNQKELPNDVTDLLAHAVSLNSGYTSKVLVSSLAVHINIGPHLTAFCTSGFVDGVFF